MTREDLRWNQSWCFLFLVTRDFLELLRQVLLRQVLPIVSLFSSGESYVAIKESLPRSLDYTSLETKGGWEIRLSLSRAPQLIICDQFVVASFVQHTLPERSRKLSTCAWSANSGSTICRRTPISSTHGSSLQSWHASTRPRGYSQHGFIPRIDYVDLWFQFVPKSNMAASSSYSNSSNQKHVPDKNTVIHVSICGQMNMHLENMGHGFCA